MSKYKIKDMLFKREKGAVNPIAREVIAILEGGMIVVQYWDSFSSSFLLENLPETSFISSIELKGLKEEFRLVQDEVKAKLLEANKLIVESKALCEKHGEDIFVQPEFKEILDLVEDTGWAASSFD